MVDIIDSKWSELDASNTSAAPDGVQGGYAPSTIAPILRSTRGALKRFYVQNNAIYTSGGSANAYTLTYAGAPTAYSKGVQYAFWANHTNTGAATLNINALGAKAIVTNNGTALTAGQIVSGTVVIVYYDGASFRVQNTAANPTFSGTVTASTFVGAHSGVGSSLTALNASQLTTGTVPNARLSGSYDFSVLTLSDELRVNAATPEVRLQRDGVSVATLYFDGSGTTGNLVLRRYNPSTGAGEGYIRIDGNGATDFKYNGATVWHASNDGSGSGLDADLIDGYEVSRLFRDNASFNTTGNLKISNSAPQIQLIDTTSGSYSGRLRLDNNNVYFDSSTDDVTFGEVFRFELDTKIGYMAGSRIWSDAYATASRLNTVYGYTPANGANSITAGNGLSGGGTIGASRTITLGTPGTITASSTNSVSSTSHTHAISIDYADVGAPPTSRQVIAGNGLTGGGSFGADRTITLGTPGNITNSTTNSVSSASHTHALGFVAAEVSTTTSAGTTSFPLGHLIVMYKTGNPVARNSEVQPAISSSDDYYYRWSGQSDAGNSLAGTWRSRGHDNDGRFLAQRVA